MNGTQRVQIKGVLLVGSIGLQCRYKRFVFWLLQSAQKTKFLFHGTLFQFLCLQRQASWAGSRAGSPVTKYVSLDFLRPIVGFKQRCQSRTVVLAKNQRHILRDRRPTVSLTLCRRSHIPELYIYHCDTTSNLPPGSTTSPVILPPVTARLTISCYQCQ